VCFFLVQPAIAMHVQQAGKIIMTTPCTDTETIHVHSLGVTTKERIGSSLPQKHI
jgi:hypothetical protein